MFLHDLLKIKYIEQGFLPNYPYSMITDAEMFDAFLLQDEGYFAVNYPLLDDSLQDKYDELFAGIRDHISMFLNRGIGLPSWIYSYMLGNTFSVNSDTQDIAYLYELMNLDPQVVDTFGPDLQRECLKVSEAWIAKLPIKYGSRPATMFGEPHVIKSLRLAAVNVLDSSGGE